MVQVYEVDPRELVITPEVMAAARGDVAPPSSSQVVKMAYLLTTFGQESLVEVRDILVPDATGRYHSRLEVVSGFKRVMAGQLIRNGFHYRGRFYRDRHFLLSCAIVRNHGG